MNLVSKEELMKRKDFYKEIMGDSIFIYPTDTIYGLGCNALHKELVKELRTIKNSGNQLFSVIAPSKKWIVDNCILDDKAEEWLAKLPGPYTLILPLKNKQCVVNNVSPGLETIGVRIPDHWIAEVVKELGFPIITTSVNVLGEEFMTSIDDLDPQIAHVVDYIFYEGVIVGNQSTIVHLENGSGKIQERKRETREKA
jgi:tRNA threonylcarbamoyl adenosine modification protein (Sua5/YciO/YrdC/YwlC family)